MARGGTGGALGGLTDEAIRAMNWYYQVELRPGVYTGGRIRGTSSMTREVVRNIDVTDRTCIDVGAQEALLAVLMARQGAKRVACYDRLDLTDRLALVQEAYGVELDYFHSLQLNELPARLAAENVAPYDVVIFAGVLYHMIDPLAGLATVRSLVREGGLVVVETSVMANNSFTAEINAKGRFYPGSNYFQISLGSLDYFLRMMRLEPIDLLYTRPSDAGVCRATIVCRAVSKVVATTDDTWIHGNWITSDFTAAHLHYDRLKSSETAVPYHRPGATSVNYAGTNVMDVWATFDATDPHQIRRDEGRLSLDDHD